MDRRDKFRTILSPEPSQRPISYSDRLYCMGSCFVENIGGMLDERRFPIHINPFGILYNPISVAGALERLLENKFIETHELIEDRQGIFHHWDFHGDFSNPDKEKALQAMNQNLELGRKNLLDAEVLMLTFGTTGVWELMENKKAVANCHKFPASTFEHRHLELKEMSERWQGLMLKLKNETNIEHIILTVSPVRYLQQGFEANSLSKAKLRLLCDQLQQSFDFIEYFPAFELLQDDLRDYRFYDKDLVHPSEMAIEYVWDKFSNSFFNPETKKTIEEVEAILNAAAHKPFNPESEAHLEFCRNQTEKVEALKAAHPAMELEDLISIFKSYL